MKNHQCSSHPNNLPSMYRQHSLPIAKPLYYDFLTFGRDFGWEEVADESGCTIMPIPIATEVALIEPPQWFPKLPEINGSVDAELREAIEGVQEVVNIFESLHPSFSMQNACVKCVRKMEKAFNMAAADLTVNKKNKIEKVKRDAMIQIFESTTYELEALVGAIQIFGNKHLSDVPGTLRVGAFLTFPWYSFEQNYNLNFVMTRWMRANWCFPYPSHADIYKLMVMYNFDSGALLSWIDNAIKLVWQPLSSMEWLERFDLEVGDKNQDDDEGAFAPASRRDVATQQLLNPFQLPLKRLVQT